jgi:hypothetical protein
MNIIKLTDANTGAFIWVVADKISSIGKDREGYTVVVLGEDFSCVREEPWEIISKMLGRDL